MNPEKLTNNYVIIKEKFPGFKQPIDASLEN